MNYNKQNFINCRISSSYYINFILFFIVFSVFFFGLNSSVLASSSNDTFTETVGTLLQSHVSDSGNTWTKVTGTTGSMAVTDVNRIRGNTAVTVVYVNNWTPASADYDVSTDVYISSAVYNQIGVGGRSGTGSTSGYYALLVIGPKVSLYRAGNATPLANYFPTLSAGQTHNMKLSMRGNNIQVYWDNASVIDVTVSGADIISDVGLSSVYSGGAFTDSTGVHLDNFLATDPSLALTPGILSETSHTDDSATVSWTNAGNGTAPITAQLERSPSGAGTWSNVSGATTSPVTDTGLSSSTAYDYRVAYTDAVPTTVYSNTVTITTDEASTTYSVLQADLWDNGYDNVATPRQSNFSRFVFTTNAASVIIGGTTSMYTSYPQFAHLGLRINGVDQSSLLFTVNGSQNFTVPLGTAGTTRTVEIISGAQSKPSGTVVGSFIDSVTYLDSASFSVQAPSVGTDRILIYGDSIAAGGNATNPEIEAYVPLLRNTYGHNVMLESWGIRSLHDDTNTSGLRSAFVSRIAGYLPAVIWFAIGTNDYGLNKWNAADFGTAYAATLDDLHTALPSARIYCQTPIVRSTETANTFGNTTGDYRSQITTICNARSSWATPVDGSAFLATSNLTDGIHPNTAGHAIYASAVNNILTVPPTVSFTSTVDTGRVMSDTVSAEWGASATTKKWDYDSDGICSNNAIDYSKLDSDSMSQIDETNNTKFICLYGEDILGNKATLASDNPINVDITSPSTPLSNKTVGSYNSTQSITLSATGSDYIKYSIDSLPANCSSGTSYTVPIEVSTTQTIYVRACDNAGNSSSASFQYTISTAHLATGSMSFFALAQQQQVQTTSEEQKSSINSISSIAKTLRFKATGQIVKTLQLFLISQNIGEKAKALAKNGATNYFGKLTKSALMEWQKANDLKDDGILGPKTKAKIKLLGL